MSVDHRLGHELEMEHYKPHESSLSQDMIDKIHVKHLGRVSGFDVWTVNGELIRDQVHVDFTEGGNPGRYLYCPEGEIWVESTLDKVDLQATIIHEVTECLLMQREKLSYAEAHDKASSAEMDARAKLGKVSEAVEDPSAVEGPAIDDTYVGPDDQQIVGDKSNLSLIALSSVFDGSEVVVGDAWQDEQGDLQGAGILAVLLFEPAAKQRYKNASLGRDISPLSVLDKRLSRCTLLRTNLTENNNG